MSVLQTATDTLYMDRFHIECFVSSLQSVTIKYGRNV